MTQQPAEDDAIRHIFRLAEQDIRQVVTSERNAQALADHYRVLANRQRDEIARLQVHSEQVERASEGRRTALEQVGEERRAEWTRAENAEADVSRLRQDLADAAEANRAYAATLTRIRGALGATEDGDLVEEVARLRAFARAACCWRLAETSWDEHENAKAPALLDLFRADIDALAEWGQAHANRE